MAGGERGESCLGLSHRLIQLACCCCLLPFLLARCWQMTEAARTRREKAEKQKETAAAASVSESGSTAAPERRESGRRSRGDGDAGGNEAQPANQATTEGKADSHPKSSGVGAAAPDANATRGRGARTK